MDRVILIEKNNDKDIETAVYEREGRSILSLWGIKDNNLTSYSIMEGTSTIFRFCYRDLYEVNYGPIEKMKLQTLIIPSTVREIRNADLPLSISHVINYSPFFEVSNKTIYTRGKKELLRCYDFSNDGSFLISNEVETIKRDAFCGCRFKTIIIGESVREIEGNPFMNMVHNSAMLEIVNHSLFIHDEWEGGIYNDNKELIAYVGNQEEYHVADGTISIKDFAFSGSKVNKIWLPSSIKAFNIEKYIPSNKLLFIIPDSLKYDYPIWNSQIVTESKYRISKSKRNIKYTGEF
jgi:hypothetical protein